METFVESTPNTYISKLSVSNFRNYLNLRSNFSHLPVVLVGKNGSGKTNILEIISMLAPGKGIHNCSLTEMDHTTLKQEKYPWAISSNINIKNKKIQIGTGRNIDSNTKSRVNKIDNKIVKNQSEFSKLFNIIWITPKMDNLFYGPSSERRKFMDRLVCNFYPNHASIIHSYETSIRERSKLLQNKTNPNWLLAIETKIAELSIAAAASRIETLEIIQKYIFKSNTLFPKALIKVEGFVEDLLKENINALQSEKVLKEKLFKNREKDLITGRTNIGIHRSDLNVFFLEKNIHASSCSTGEQKALLISIILAELRAKATNNKSMPILLIDEVAAHLDTERLENLFEELLRMNIQAWFTGTDKRKFNYLSKKAQFFTIINNTLESIDISQ